MMWKEIVNANWIRARSKASRSGMSLSPMLRTPRRGVWLYLSEDGSRSSSAHGGSGEAYAPTAAIVIPGRPVLASVHFPAILRGSKAQATQFPTGTVGNSPASMVGAVSSERRPAGQVRAEPGGEYQGGRHADDEDPQDPGNERMSQVGFDEVPSHDPALQPDD